MKIIPVILSGGSGNRLWPLSRKQFPKQYLPLVGENSMLQETLIRLDGIENLSSPIILCNEDHRFIVAEQLKQIDINNASIILEPVLRNTAPAIIASAIYSLQAEVSEDSILLILSADHFIQDAHAFYDALSIALEQAENGKIVIFGIKPTYANTGYGYIQVESASDNHASSVMNVKSFKEKPSIELAKSYLVQNDNQALSWFWNSGIFVVKASTIINEASIHANEMLSKVKNSVENSVNDLDFIRLDEKTFASSPNISIDFALIEKSINVNVVPMDAKWTDIGSWASLYEVGDKDRNNNLIVGDVVSMQTTNSYINSSNQLVATIGIDNLIVVSTSDAILIASREKSQEVKDIVEKLQLGRRNEAHSNRKVYRPWGWYDSIETGKHFQVKRLHVNPGAKLSLQMHKKRAEHWVVVNGEATITIGEEVSKLKEGGSAYIEIGVIHSLENKTDEMLEIIEVQNGTYLGEDDIFRFDDNYGRS